MASQTQGIQQLLAAEKRAAEKINEARKRKNLRLKQAKQEAQAEIEKYRQVSIQQLYDPRLFLRIAKKHFVTMKLNISARKKISRQRFVRTRRIQLKICNVQ